MNIVNVLSELGTGIAKMFVDALNELTKIFFITGEGGAIVLQPLAYIALIGLVIGIVWKLFNFVKNLIKSR